MNPAVLIAVAAAAVGVAVHKGAKRLPAVAPQWQPIADVGDTAQPELDADWEDPPPEPEGPAQALGRGHAPPLAHGEWAL